MFSKEKLVEKVNEAEQLVTYVQMNRGPVQGPAIVRWLVVADEATALLQQAQEHLSEEEIEALKQQVNAINPRVDVWGKYSDNPRRAKAFFGKELFEQGDNHGK